MDQRLNKWISWLKICEEEIHNILVYRDIFWKVQDLIKSNKASHKPSSFYSYLGDTFVSYIAIAIRRQVKIGKQSISFARLLKEISDDPKHISRKYFTSLYRGSNVEHHADSDFDQFSGKGKDYISSSMVLNDLSLLQKTAGKIEGFADKKIAHRDKRPPKVIPTFNDVDDCIDVLDKLYCKYYLIFHALAMGSLMPTYQYDWMSVFDIPWRLPQKESI